MSLTGRRSEPATAHTDLAALPDGPRERAILLQQTAPHLVRPIPHGTEATTVLAHAGGDPTLLGPIAPGVDVPGAEVLHALRVEGALTVDDILDRRTRIGLVPADRAAAATAVETLVSAERQATAS